MESLTSEVSSLLKKADKSQSGFPPQGNFAESALPWAFELSMGHNRAPPLNDTHLVVATLATLAPGFANVIDRDSPAESWTVFSSLTSFPSRINSARTR